MEPTEIKRKRHETQNFPCATTWLLARAERDELVALVGGSESEITFRVVLGGQGTAIKTDRSSRVVPSPVYSGPCVGNTASVFNDRFQRLSASDWNGNYQISELE